MLLLERRQRVARMHDRLLDAMVVVGVQQVAEWGGIFGDILRVNAAKIVDTAAGIGHGECAIRSVPQLQQKPRHDRRDLVVAILDIELADGLRDLAHGAVVVERLASLLVAYQAHILLDPDALARLMAVNLRDDVRHLAVLEHHLVDLGATVRIDVPFVCDVGAIADELSLVCVTVQPDERRIGADHPSLERRPEHAVADALVEMLETGLGTPNVDKGPMALVCEDRKAERCRCANGGEPCIDRSRVRRALRAPEEKGEDDAGRQKQGGGGRADRDNPALYPSRPLGPAPQALGKPAHS